MNRHAVVATGHSETTNAAIAILESGGNAFDAAIAAAAASTVAEPMLSSFGGGGFLLARPVFGPAAGKTRLLDFFVQTPKTKRRSPLDFYPITGHFGEDTQEFHIGLASIATPGLVKGLWAIADHYATMPMRALLEPAIALAKDGVTVNSHQAYTMEILDPILRSQPYTRALFIDNGGWSEGERLTMPDLAAFMDSLAREGERFFHEGEPARQLLRDCSEGGGLLTPSDLSDYRVIEREPLNWTLNSHEIWCNPPPSSGGMLLAAASLSLFSALNGAGIDYRGASRGDSSGDSFGDTSGKPDQLYYEALIRAQDLANQARKAPDWQKALAAKLREQNVHGLPMPSVTPHESQRGTSHIAIMDKQGNIASMTLSNGEGSGYMIPGTGVMMNNMLGEEDLSPHGFHQWPEDTRVGSMMSPLIAQSSHGEWLAMGSGGSNRIRSALLQVLTRHTMFGESLEQAIAAPRVHLESSLLSWETPGLDTSIGRWLPNQAPASREWNRRNLFFGGVQAVMQNAASGEASAGADPRRGGDAKVL